MHTAWSANFTCSASVSAVECTATVSRPSSLHARMMRSAISPRLATRTLRNISGQLEQGLTVLDRGAILDEDPHDRAGRVGLDLVHELHRLDDAEHLTLVDLVVEAHVVRRVR